MSDEQERLEHALGIAYRYLNSRERTMGEIRSQLERKQTEPETIEQALTILEREGLVDDARFARLFVQDKRTLEQWGGERIRRGLRARGVSAELIESALAGSDRPSDDRSFGESELERAIAILGRRFPIPPRERRDRDRALGVLLRKGYDPELALDALTAYARSA